uniref:Uncharacterized protein n=1 Tax=Liagora harveyana TaxID=406718 RepID=A0A1G4NV27_9FLOR|nr:Hypothetical protein ORF_20 [Liagora harveyana]SCW22497.1 Hypothetical protein ORF_20 [Liagora harveyana]
MICKYIYFAGESLINYNHLDDSKYLLFINLHKLA